MDGVFCLDKPAGISSFAACSRVRRTLGAEKAGHAGTLDPMATGVLPVFIGSATKALAYLPSQGKRYRLEVRFGLVSDTEDIWGKVTPTGGVLPDLSAIEAALPRFRGEIEQIPPMVSALKHNGVRLYRLARQGEEIPRPARKITVTRLEICSFRGDTLTLDCSCSKGAYMRTLAADLGRALGCGAVMSALRRTEAAGFTLGDCVTSDHLAQMPPECLMKRIMPVDSALGQYPAVTVTCAQAKRFQNGGGLFLNRLAVSVSGLTRVYAPNGAFLGLGQPSGELLAAVRLMGGRFE